MKLSATVLQGIGLAVLVFACAMLSPILGVIVLGVELVMLGIALEAR